MPLLKVRVVGLLLWGLQSAENAASVLLVVLLKRQLFDRVSIEVRSWLSNLGYLAHRLRVIWWPALVRVRFRDSHACAYQFATGGPRVILLHFFVMLGWRSITGGLVSVKEVVQLLGDLTLGRLATEMRHWLPWILVYKGLLAGWLHWVV